MLPNSSPVGRLLDELSWEGNARRYRDGGRGRENVLVTEVFQAIDLLPRTAFLGQILRQAHGDNSVLDAAASGAEDAVVEVLPGGPDLRPGGPNVQPDALLMMPRATVLVEAKRIRPGSFQVEQLAREYLVLMRDHAVETRVLLLVLPHPPPIAVKGRGRLSVKDAVLHQMEAVHSRSAGAPSLAHLLAQVDRACAWITWPEIDRILADGREGVTGIEASVLASIRRTADAGRRAIAFHG